MEEWKEYKIEETSIEMIDGDRGKNYPKNDEFFTEGYCLFLNAGNVTKNGFSFSENSFITREKDDALRKGRLDRYDVVITTRGTVGNVALYDMNVPFEHVRINSGMLILKSGKDIMPEYLYYYLKGITFQTQISQYVSGSAQPQLPKGTLAKMSVSYPYNKDTQKRIIAILKSLDDKIECNRRINENLEQQAQALFKSWFVDFEPFKDQPFVESELGMIPQGWRVECLNEFGKIVCGKTPSKAESSYYGGNIPFVKIPDMHNNIFVLHSEDCLSDLGDKSQVGKRIPPYSVLVSCIATVGLVGMNVRTCHTNQQINTIIPNSIEYRYYLYQKLVSLREYLINLGRGGTATLNVNTRQFGNIRIVRPSDKVLSEYHQRISCLFDKIEINSLESRRLAELRDTLLPRLMSGELHVSDM